MIILVTGGSGFLGRHIVAECIKAGYETIAPRSSEFNLETTQNVRKFLDQQLARHQSIDAIIHSAAYYGGIGINQLESFNLMLKNTKMATTIFAEAVRIGVKKFISVGSTCAYPGNMPENDMEEKHFFNGRCHDSIEAYGFTKRVQLVLMTAAHKQHGISCNQIALTNLYGEHDVFSERRSHVLSSLIKKIVDAKLSDATAKAWGSGRPVRQFLYVKDAARVIVKALEFSHDDWPVNVGGTALTIRELAHTIADIVGLPRQQIVWDSSKPDGVARKVVSEKRLHELLPNYQPTPFGEGLTQTIRWYMANKQQADERA